MHLMTIFLLHLIFLCSLATADYNYIGCYSQDIIQTLGLTSKGWYLYQSVSYCELQCDNSDIVALLNGGNCYCGDSAKQINSILSASSSGDNKGCDVPCNGWPYQNCGGKSSIDLYVNADVKIESNTVSSSRTTSTLFSSSSSITSTSISSSYTSTTSTSSSSSSTSTTSTSSSFSSTTSTTSTINSQSEKSITTSSTSLIPSSSMTISISSSTTSSSEISSTTQNSETSVSTSQSKSSSSLTSSTTQTSSSSTSTTSSTSISTPIFTVTKTLSNSDTPITQKISYITSIQYSTAIITQSVVSHVGNDQTTIYVTTTSVEQINTSTSTLGLSSLNKGTSSTHNKLSGGSIAGVVVGVVCGVLLLAAILFFLFWRRRKSVPDDYTEYRETIQHQPYSFGETEQNVTEIPMIPNDLNWLSSKNKRNSDSLSDSSNTEFINSPTSRHLTNTGINTTYNFEAPQYYDRDIFSASSLHNADEGMLHIVNPDTSSQCNDLNKNETSVSSVAPDSTNISNDTDVFEEKS